VFLQLQQILPESRRPWREYRRRNGKYRLWEFDGGRTSDWNLLCQSEIDFPEEVPRRKRL
jgi:hypothetical protein